MTLEHLDKMDQCRHLLPDPAPEVVGELINDLRRYVKAMDAIYNHNEVARAAVIQHFGLNHLHTPLGGCSPANADVLARGESATSITPKPQ
jgi:hypothetical protein